MSVTGRYISTTIVKERRREREKKGRGGLGCGGWGLNKGEFWVVGGADAQDPQGWKRPWALLGVGLRLKEQKGPRRAPHPSLRGQGTSPGSPAGSLGPSGQGDGPPLLSCSSWKNPSRLPLLIFLASGALILSGLHFSYPLGSPTSYRFTLVFLPSPWRSESSLTSSRQAP